MRKIDKKELIKKLRLKYHKGIIYAGTKGIISQSLVGFTSDDAIARLTAKTVSDFLRAYDKNIILAILDENDNELIFCELDKNTNKIIEIYRLDIN